MTHATRDRITPRARQLLEVLRAAADSWLSRSELARRTGKNQLSQHDIVLLDRLTAAALVESRQVEHAGGIPFAVEYRAAAAAQDTSTETETD